MYRIKTLDDIWSDDEVKMPESPLDPRLIGKIKMAYTQALTEEMEEVTRLAKKVTTSQLKKAVTRSGFESFGDGGKLVIGSSILTVDKSGVVFQKFEKSTNNFLPVLTITADGFSGSIATASVNELKMAMASLERLKRELRRETQESYI